MAGRGRIGTGTRPKETSQNRSIFVLNFGAQPGRASFAAPSQNGSRTGSARNGLPPKSKIKNLTLSNVTGKFLFVQIWLNFERKSGKETPAPSLDFERGDEEYRAAH